MAAPSLPDPRPDPSRPDDRIAQLEATLAAQTRQAGGLPGDAADEASALTSHAGDPIHRSDDQALLVVQEMTERKQAEAALRASQQNLHALIENTDGSIWSVDTQYRLIIGNARFQRTIYGAIGREPIVGECLLDLPLPQPFLDEWRAAYERALRGETFSRDVVTPYRSEPRTMEYRFHPIRTAEGTIAGVTVHGQDITQRIQTEQALRDTERKLGTLFELLPVGVAVLDAQGEIVYANPALGQIVQLDRAGLYHGEHLARSYLRPDGTPLPRENLPSARAVREHRPVTNSETGIVTEAGAVLWTTVSAVPVEFPDWRVVVVTSDVTERKRAEAQVHAALAAEQAARQTAEQAVEHVGQLQAVTAALATTLTREEVVRIALDHGSRVTGARFAMFGLLNAQEDQLEVVEQTQALPASLQHFRVLPLDAPLPPAHVMRTQTPIWIESRADGEAQFPGFGPLLDQASCNAYAGVPLIAGGRTIGVLGLVFGSPRTFPDDERALLLAIAQQCAQALERARLYHEVQTAQLRLQQLSQRLIEAQEQERRHLARELHDEVGQALTGLRLTLEMLGRPASEEQAGRLDEAYRVTQRLITQVRQLSLDLRPAMLDDLGLLPALLWQLTRFGEQSGIAVELRHWGLEGRLPLAVETVAYRVVQEALTNVARHAGVSTATVNLLATPTQLTVQISDAGRGFVLETALGDGHSSGLLGMQERVALLSGTLSIETAPGAGTCVTAELPVSQEPEL